MPRASGLITLRPRRDERWRGGGNTPGGFCPRRQSAYICEVRAVRCTPHNWNIKLKKDGQTTIGQAGSRARRTAHGDGAAAQNAKPFVIPEVKEWKGGDGHFVPDGGMRITYRDDALHDAAQAMADGWTAVTGTRPAVVKGRAGRGDVQLLADGRMDDAEEYAIDIADRVTVRAGDTAGFRWGTSTLLQMMETCGGRLPRGEVRDEPDYAMRGLVLDCGRKFIPLAYLRDLVRVMAYHKMNVLHLHLNDNGFKQYFGNDWDKTYAAFRLECDTYPGLAARDGHYTKREFAELQRWAAAQGVEIIPEIDVPAHSLAFSHYRDGLGSETYGKDHLDLANPATREFVDALFAEYLGGDDPVFTGPRVHIGTDEYSNSDPAVVEQFRAFTDHYIDLVESYGKQACVWGALTHAAGETEVKSEDVVMYAWNNAFADPAAMAAEGYSLVSIPDWQTYIVPAATYYHDYLDTRDLYDNWSPAHVGGTVFEEGDEAIVGGMFAVWNDHVGNGISVGDIHHRLYPALQTIAVKTWNAHPTIPYQEFETMRRTLSEAPGVNRLGRIAKGEKTIRLPGVEAGGTTGVECVGYPYTVSFDLVAEEEARGTVLFSSADAVFYLSDPVAGMFGFTRDGYLNTFNFRPYPGEKMHIDICGDSISTTLKVNGQVVERLDVQRRYYNAGRDSMNYVRTLVFPLQRAGAFKSKVTNLEISNFIK